MLILRNVEAMRDWRHRPSHDNKTIAFFYTKGSLQEAHLNISTQSFQMIFVM